MIDSATRLNAAIAELVRERRVARGLSQEHLASLCGLDRTYVSSIERKRSNVSIQTLAKLADALEISPAEMLTELAKLTDR